MQKSLCLITLLSIITCQLYAAENRINQLDRDGMLFLHGHVANKKDGDSQKACAVALIIRANASVYELPKCNKNALQFALENAQKFPKTLEVFQAAALLEGVREQTGMTQAGHQQDPYLQKLCKRAEKTIDRHINAAPPIIVGLINSDLERRFKSREESKS